MDSFVARVRSPNPRQERVENVVADHLSRLAIAHNSHVLPINDDFPEESLMLLEKAPWYAHIANYLVTGEVPNQIIRKCVPEEEQQGILSHCHENACGGHFASQKTAMKVLQSGFTWPSLFKDSHIMCRSCDRCQRLGKLTKRNQMPMNPILIVDLFDVWGIDFMGPFPMSFAKYGVKHKVATPYHPQTSGQVELANREIKNILMKVVITSRKDWSIKLHDSLWAYRTLQGLFLRLNMDLIRAGEKRCLDLNEMEELRNDAYINSKVAKQRMKRWHDQLISNKVFHKGQRVLLYDSRLHVFPRKLNSRWIGPFIIHQVHPNGVVELLNSKGTEIFKVNGAQAQHTAILRQIQHHLGITAALEHAISQLIRAITAPPFVDQPMPHQEPSIGEAAEHHSVSLRRYHFLPMFQSLLSH
ncbi:putative mitochondrial protein [Vitis vinifera]|uniref:Putative mitochondrial protein n=1 Tax=Vitis vinifera TaxID=29760 RepID=A0A438JBI6_VITVI|nr:putative mitochondrial protein [Vitis vinifera]